MAAPGRMVGGWYVPSPKANKEPDKPKPKKQPKELDLSIKQVESAKQKIPQRVLMKKNVIPRHPSSVIFNGSSGSGKTTLLVNLLTRPEFFKGYFDRIVLMAPTGGTDDLFQNLKVSPKDINIDMDPKFLEDIMDEQKAIIDKKGIEKAPKVLLIYEDVQANVKFMNSKPFLKSFIANRHYGMSTWLCGQSYTKTPRPCRLQANNIFFFKGSASERLKIVEEYCPPGLNRKQFGEIADHAVKEEYNFLHINQRAKHAERYRKNLDVILDWEQMIDT